MKSRTMVAVFLTLAAAQLLLYANFMSREVAWNYNLHGDPTWYVYFNYMLYQAVVERTWDVIWQQAVISPWGILLFLEALIPQFLFGPSRFSVGVINLGYFLLGQVAVYVFFARLTRTRLGGVSAVAVLMAMQTPFRGDGPGLNIADFHFDLVLFFLLVVLHLMVAWSNSFALRNRAILVGLVAGLIVATRLVSFFLLTGVLGVFGLILAYRWWRSGRQGPGLAQQRFSGYLTSMGVYLATSIVPILVAKRALYDHYFRFVFDEKFIAEKAGLYAMGATSKLDEAYEVMARMLMFDFGYGYLPVIAIAVITVLISARKAREPVAAEAPAAEDATDGDLGAVMDDRDARRTFWIFLVVSCVTSYVMHIVFPIKSDHLTRMTAAPLLIVVMLLLVPNLVRQWGSVVQWRRVYSRFAVGTLVVSAVVIQLAFYTGPGRLHDKKREMIDVHDLFADIASHIAVRRLNKVAISVDRVGYFELGAMRSMAIYDFERNGRLLDFQPMLGGAIDSPMDLNQAKRLLGGSDVILLGSLPYPQNRLPFMKSMLPIAEQVHQHVEGNFCLYKEYTLFGEKKRLYVNPEKGAWRYSASASTDPRYGPDGLLEGSSRIWHAPWGSNTTQWVEFQRDAPVSFTNLTVVAQDGAPKRAPRDFSLEVFDAKHQWVPMLNVKGADFSTSQSRSWPVTLDRPYNRFRLMVTRNNGDSTFMTIQDMKFDTSLGNRCPSSASALIR